VKCSERLVVAPVPTPTKRWKSPDFYPFTPKTGVTPLHATTG